VSSAARPIPFLPKINHSADQKIARTADDREVAPIYLPRGRSRKEHTMRNIRNGLILAGLTFAAWETIDIFWISFPAAAAVFAALFACCTIWFWRRNSSRAAAALMVLFAFEGAVAPTLKAMTLTKVADFTLALTGIAFAVAVLATRRRTKRTRPAT
jgi:FtsH-binding integral membrane protein